MMEEPFHPTPHQGMPHVHITDAEEGAKAQLHQKLPILLTSSVQKLTEVGPSISANALTRILHRIRKKSVSTEECEKGKAKKSVKYLTTMNQRRWMVDEARQKRRILRRNGDRIARSNATPRRIFKPRCNVVLWHRVRRKRSAITLCLFDLAGGAPVSVMVGW